MNKREKEPTRILFGKQLARYRRAYGLSKTSLGELTGFTNSYVSLLETAQFNVGVDNMDKMADFFDVSLYEMLNPYFPISINETIFKQIGNFKEQAKKYKVNRTKQPRIKLAPFIDELLNTKFLKKPRTLAEIAEALKEKVVVPQNKIAVLLGKHPRNQLVKTIPGKEWGGKVNKYVLV